MSTSQAGQRGAESNGPLSAGITGNGGTDPRGTCRQCDGPLGEDNVDDVCGPCVAEIVEPETEPCSEFRSIGVGRLGDAERALFCRCGWEYADHTTDPNRCTCEECSPCPWSDAEECAMAAERSVAGTDDDVPPCITHARDWKVR